jgi:hypothetical protein
VCIDDDNDAMLYSAVERLMGKTRDEIHDQIRQTLIGNFRACEGWSEGLAPQGGSRETRTEEIERCP